MKIVRDTAVKAQKTAIIGSTAVATAKPTPRSTGTVIVRMHWHAETIAYVERRTSDGLSKKGIIRCLKRYVLCEFYALLPDTQAAPPLQVAA